MAELIFPIVVRRVLSHVTIAVSGAAVRSTVSLLPFLFPPLKTVVKGNMNQLHCCCFPLSLYETNSNPQRGSLWRAEVITTRLLMLGHLQNSWSFQSPCITPALYAIPLVYQNSMFARCTSVYCKRRPCVTLRAVCHSVFFFLFFKLKYFLLPSPIASILFDLGESRQEAWPRSN